VALLRAGVNVKVVAEGLGHSRASFTLDVYMHVLPGMGEVASAIETARGGGLMAERKDIRPSELPFPWPDGTDPVTTWGPLGSGEFRDFPTTLTVGTTMMTTPGDSRVEEGVLAFYQDALGMFFYDGTRRGVPYTEIAAFRLKRGLRVRKLTLHGTDGQTRHFRIGPELAAKARYVLSAKGIAQRLPGCWC